MFLGKFPWNGGVTISKNIAHITISSLLILVTTIHGISYVNAFVEQDNRNGRYMERFYPISSLFDNQTNNIEILNESNLENSDPFKIKGSDIDKTIRNISSTDGVELEDVELEDVESEDVESEDVESEDAESEDAESEEAESSDEKKQSKSTSDDIPLELPFP